MWKLEDIVVYGSSGICRICEIKNEMFCGEEKQYYVLKPLFDDKTTLFVPSFNEALMSKIHPVLTGDEARDLIEGLERIDPVWIDNDKMRHDTYRDIMESADRKRIVGIIKALRQRRSCLALKGKKLRTSDDIVLRSCELLIGNECAYVLNIARSDVQEMFLSQPTAE